MRYLNSRFYEPGFVREQTSRLHFINVLKQATTETGFMFLMKKGECVSQKTHDYPHHVKRSEILTDTLGIAPR